MNLNVQPSLINNRVILQPLKATDFETLFQVASDPKIWEQHPNQDRWKKEVFKTFFEGAMLSKGAFIITEPQTGAAIGCTRFYDYNAEDNSIFIGYTFYATNCWGKGINSIVKSIMLTYIFKWVSKVYFHIGAKNIRSQIALERLGAVKIAEEEVMYFGEAPKLNFVYEIAKENWQSKAKCHTK